jgi:TonB-linked SusC/RagA family outer membrane protein
MFLKLTSDLTFSKWRYLKKTLLIMKFFAIFLFAACMQASATGYSQKISLAQNDVSLKKVFKEIEAQSGYHFFYKDKVLKQAGNVSVHLSDATIEEVLNQCFKGLPLSYSILDKIVVVKAKKPTLNPIPPLEAFSITPLQIITGTVKDSKGNPLAGVSVVVKGTTRGTSTANDGSFSIDADKGDVLEFTNVGYQKKAVRVEGDINLNIVMEIEVSVGNEVVIIGYGKSTKRNINSAISTLPMNNVAPIPVQSINDAIGGRIPGVIVTANSGAPGSKSQISIRGGGTPLFVIDGVIRSQNDFENLDPNDIETYSVLKDAASTSLYGARGGNGVVLVTTKKGAAGKININYSFNQIYSQPTIRPKKMSSYDHLAALNTVYLAEGKTPPTADTILQYYKDQTKPFEYPNTDWQKISLKNFAPEQRHDLSLSMGTKELTFYGSLSNYHQGTNLKTDHNYNNRTTYRLNTVSNFEKIHLKVTTGLDGFLEKNVVPNTTIDGGAGYNGIYSLIQNHGPQQLAYNEYGLPYAGTSGNTARILSSLSGYNRGESHVFNSILNFDYAAPFISGLHLKANGSYNMWNSINKLWNITAPAYALHSLQPIPGSPPSLTGVRGDGSTLTLQGFITYERPFGDHNIDFTGVYEQAQDKSENLSASRQRYQILFDQFIAGPTVDQLANGSESESARASYIGRLSYNFKSKYFMDATLRYDGLDLFPPGKRWGTFYAFAGGWILSEENFMKSLKRNNILEYLKLRGSIGLTGTVDGINSFQYVPGYNVNANAWVINGQPVQGTSEPGTLPSTNFSWYSIYSRDLGFDFATLQNRLRGSVDYFYKRTTGYVASDTRYAAVLGVALPPINDKNAALRREGFDFNASWSDHVGKFGYKIGFNFTRFNQLWELTYWEDEAALKNPYTRTSGLSDASLQTGYINQGFYQNNSDLLNGSRRISSTNAVAGDLEYKDANGDGKIDADDFRHIGSNTFPRVNYGLTIDLNYKGIFLNTVLMGSGKRDRYLGDVIQGGSVQGILLYGFQKDYWTPENTNALFPRQVSSPGVNGSNNFVTSDFWLLRSSYVRLKYVQLGYDLKSGVFKNMPFQDFKIFISGTNLLTFSKSLNYFIDPESDPNNYGYPIQRTIALGLNVGF